MNPTAPIVPLWERSTLRDAAGNTLRPGGLSLTDHAISLAHIPRYSRVLDVGCGLGATVHHLNESHSFEAYGIDRSAGQLEKAHSGLALSQADATNLPYSNNFFDALICECVLSLLPDMSEALAEFKRVLNSSGTLILTDIYQRGQNSSGSISGSCVTNPLNINQLDKALSDHEFHTIIKEDHSKLLAELAARLIFTGEKSIIPKGSCCDKPGYMLLIAKLNEL
ncbi:Methyltransferase domain-containing protein [Maridesulfovibrio ferrireducens]|uniref:Methyltransferase domain-containing protein n=1 Tax=Maridesulfovibrio ferrireducens TaxID=246191 RepID=A0A1G9BCK6_9BACT|nr:class I SAM-dependent methyltransferase [Maridesulfovibrio ferrireducens]SDK37221.1 Methyltransferase domain-containing protein [Maridesulfovibrio ferrireducens]